MIYSTPIMNFLHVKSKNVKISYTIFLRIFYVESSFFMLHKVWKYEAQLKWLR